MKFFNATLGRFLFLVFFLSAINSNIAQEDSDILATNYTTAKKPKHQNEVPKRLERKFRRDAARIALRMEAKNEEDLRYLNIVIPRDNVESIFNVLKKIYLHDETARSISKCNVHTYPNPSIDHFVLIFKRNADWAEPLRSGITETDSPIINDLLDEFDLIIEKHVQWNDTQDAITIRSKGPLNMAALANEFYNIEGVEEIDLGVPKVGGNDIEIKRKENGWEVSYILRFGSYIDGKGKTHTWKYEAKDNGTINFISESGDPVPEWMRCEYPANSILTRTM